MIIHSLFLLRKCQLSSSVTAFSLSQILLTVMVPATPRKANTELTLRTSTLTTPPPLLTRTWAVATPVTEALQEVPAFSTPIFQLRTRPKTKMVPGYPATQRSPPLPVREMNHCAFQQYFLCNSISDLLEGCALICRLSPVSRSWWHYLGRQAVVGCQCPVCTDC